MSDPDDVSPAEGPGDVLPEESPAALTRYELGRSVGVGGTADVRVAQDKLLHRKVALKHLHAEHAGQGDVARSFVAEARLSGRLDHPNVVPIHDLGLDADGRAWFTMKLIEGRTLGTRIRERGAAAPDVAGPGVAAGVVAGTPGFQSPEQALGEMHRVDARTDVHGVGATLYYAITGKAPYAGADAAARVAAARAGIVQPPEERTPGRYLPAGLSAIAMKALATDPAERYPSMVALRDALHRFMAGGWWFLPERLPAGTVVVREGEPGGAAYIIEAGTAEVRCHGELIRHLGPGDLFGETAVLTGGTRTATVTALTDLDVLVISRAALEAELGRDTWLAQFVRTLALRFRELHERNFPAR